MRLFLYGTLLDPTRLARMAGRVVATAPAEVAGWRRVRLRGVPYPTLAPARGRVPGALIEADPPLLRRLAAYEGARYRLLPVTARTVTGPVRAHAWIADAATRRPWP